MINKCEKSLFLVTPNAAINHFFNLIFIINIKNYEPTA